VVLEGRRSAAANIEGARPLVTDWQEYADGRILSGKEAMEVGLIDELGTFEDAVLRAEKLAGLARRATLIEFQQRLDFADLLGLWGQSEGQVVKVDLGVEPPKLEAGRLYFLSPILLN